MTATKTKRKGKRFTYATELEAHGWTEGLPAFEDLLADQAANVCRGLAPDSILIHFRRFALPLIRAIVQKAGLTGKQTDLEELISAVLLNSRKRNSERRGS